ncbi:MAG: hypothetical protein ABEJ58_09820 [Halodesulfurarchaeum sp.]
MTTMEDLEAPLRDAARRLGLEELKTRLLSAKYLDHSIGSHDGKCPDCRAYITETSSYGEVGHRRGCSRRERKYSGLSGRKQEATGAAAGGELEA